MTETTGPVVFVLGANGGIGSALVRRLRGRGDTVVAAGRNAAALDELAEETGATRQDCDALDAASVEAAFAATVERHGRLDGAVNCVGSLLLKPAHLTTPEEWRRTLAINLDSAFHVTRAAGRLMKSGGSVVLISSAAARAGIANHEAIAAAKAGIIGLALAAAASYAARGLRFNAVAPGLTATPMTERITGSEQAARASTAMHALGRLGRPEDIASMLAWLVDPEQSWVTGQVFGVDGGLATVRPR